MKITTKFFIPVSVVIAFLVCDFSVTKNSPLQFRKPIGTIVRDENGDGDDRAQFDKWYENMHRAAPGVNWRAMDAATRLANYNAFQNQSAQRNSPNQILTQEILANGNLIGQWNERGSANNAGRIWVADLDTATGAVYCGSDGGNVWKGDMNGNNWVVLNDKLKFPATFLRVMPQGNNVRVIVSGGTSVHYTDNDGVTWNSSTGLSVLQNWGWIKRAITLDDNLHTMYLLVEEWDYVNWNAIISIYKSTDNAVSFSPIISYPEPVYGSVDNFDVWAPRYGVSDLTFVHNDSCFTMNRTTDAISFDSNLPLSSTGNTLLAGFKDQSSFILYEYVNRNIYTSVDGGINWSAPDSTGLSPYWNTGYSCSCANPNILYLGDIECHVSNDSGNTWNVVNTWWSYYSAMADHLHADIPSVTSMRDAQGNEFQFIGTDGGLFVSHDNLQTVNNISLHGLNVSQYYCVYTNKNDYNFIYAGAQDQGFQRNQQDSGTVLGFDQVYSGDYGHICSTDGGNSIWMNYPGFTDYYANGMYGGPTASWNFNGTNPFWIPPLTADRDINTRAYCAGGNISGSGDHIIQLDANGATINAVEIPYDFNAGSGGGNLSAIEISPINHSYWYALTDNGKFFYSTNAGVTWNNSNVPGLGAHYWYGATIYASQTTLGIVYVGGSGYSNPPSYRTTDNGLTFTPITNGIPSTLIFELKGNFNDSLIFAATEVGPYVYVVAENKWYDMHGQGAPDQTYWGVDYVPATNTARFCTYGRGIWDFAITAPNINGIAENNSANGISVFPNPAVNDFSIKVNSASSQKAEISIYDLVGKRVVQQYNSLNSGENKIPINCSTFENGIYLVEVMIGNKNYTEKVVVEK
jgi:hypothetical protein